MMKDFKYKEGDRVVLSHLQITASGVYSAGVKCRVDRRWAERQSGFIYSVEFVNSVKINVLEHEIDLDKEYYRELKLDELGI